jgi:hypothetical protein
MISHLNSWMNIGWVIELMNCENENFFFILNKISKIRFQFNQRAKNVKNENIIYLIICDHWSKIRYRLKLKIQRFLSIVLNNFKMSQIWT